MPKLLTIVIPAYNMETYLERCVSSVLSIGQEEKELIDVIIVNDGSTDGTSAIAHCFQSDNPGTVRAIDKENGNYGSCVNRGLVEAKGKYIKILDADDWFDSRYFGQFVCHLRSLDVDLVVTDFNYVDVENKVINTSRIYNGNDAVQTALESCQDYWQMHSLCYRTQMLRDHGYEQTEGISYTDTEWAILPLLYVRSFVCQPFPIYQYFIGREGQTMNPATLYERKGHLIQTLTKCVKWIERERNFGISSTYVEGRFCYTLSFLYYTILVDNSGKSSAEIADFDSFLLQNAPWAYRHLDKDVQSVASRFYFVRAWRKNGYKMPQMPLVCQFRTFIHRCKVHAIWLWDKRKMRSTISHYEKMSAFLKSRYFALIDKYSTAVIDDINCPKVTEYKVFFCWLQGEKTMPKIVRLCYDSLRLNAGCYKIVFIDEDNFSNYVDVAPHIVEKFRAGKISPAHFSDVLRVNLLERYGGLWLDYTVFISEPLENYKEFWELPYFTQKHYQDKNPLNSFVKSFGCYISYARWAGFIQGSSIRHNPLFVFEKEFYNEYWRDFDAPIDYCFMDFITDFAYEYIPAVRKEMDNVPINNTEVWTLLGHLNDFYTTYPYDKILKNNFLHKLSWKFDIDENSRHTVFMELQQSVENEMRQQQDFVIKSSDISK